MDLGALIVFELLTGQVDLAVEKKITNLQSLSALLRSVAAISCLCARLFAAARVASLSFGSSRLFSALSMAYKLTTGYKRIARLRTNRC